MMTNPAYANLNPAFPVLVFGGAYSNLQATQALQSKATELGIPASNVVCTGDLVAYCAQAQQTVDLIRNWGIRVVMGNCEQSLAYDAEDCGCGFNEGSTCSALANSWFRFARQNLNDEAKLWMRSLPKQIYLTYHGLKLCFVHGGFEQINQFVFASTDADIKAPQLERSKSDVIIGGHCGIPFGELLGAHAWLNAGAIGMPANDATPETWYMLLKEEQGELHVSWHRLPYDHKAAQAAMLGTKLPEAYRIALESGLWPSTDILPEVEKQQTGDPLSLPNLSIPVAKPHML